MQLFGTSGIRRVADEELIQLALKVGLVVGGVYPSIVVGCDTRTSSPVMKHALLSGLLSAGSRCCDVGVVPLPTLAYAAREFDAGAMITASHNPPEYNGIKLVNPDGSAFDSRQRQQIEEAVLADSFTAASWEEIKSGGAHNGAVEEHIAGILQSFPTPLKLKVVVDGCCGAASLVTPELLRRLDCEVVALNCYPSGFFPHNIEPTEANLGDLMRAVKGFGADLGLAHDGDADRMMAVDDKGRFIAGDRLLVLFAREVGAKGVVTTVDASMSIDEAGFQVARTRVGDTYVSEELKGGGDFGGEPSGSWVFPNFSLCPDGIYAAARITAIAGHDKLSRLVDDIPQYPILRGSIGSQGVVMSDLEKRLSAMKPLSVSVIDGTRLDFGDGWLLIRASGTEPKIRVTAEAKSEARVRQLYDSALGAIKDCMEEQR
ncbi:MAG: phosphoglucosamine mutase [Dehalococcoidales bacterium]|nr:phosphoglucosamine mutase [Dehalococcoidales bacterium]